MDHVRIIEEFQALDSLDDRTRQDLAKLQEESCFWAPETFWDRFWHGFKSQMGLCAILNAYEQQNAEAAALYRSVRSRYESAVSSSASSETFSDLPSSPVQPT